MHLMVVLVCLKVGAWVSYFLVELTQKAFAAQIGATFVRGAIEQRHARHPSADRTVLRRVCNLFLFAPALPLQPSGKPETSLVARLRLACSATASKPPPRFNLPS